MRAPEQPTRPLFLRPLLFAQAIDSVGRGVIMAITAVYFVQLIGIEARDFGTAATAAGAAGVAGAYVCGIIADRVTLKWVVLGTCLIEGTALLLLTTATTALAFGCFAGLFAAANRGGYTARNTVIALAVTGAVRTRVRAQARVAINLGVAAGSALAALVLVSGQSNYFRAAMVFAALASLTAGAASLTLPAMHGPNTRVLPQRAVSASPWLNKRFVGLTFVNIAVCIQFSIVDVGLPLWVTSDTRVPTVLVGALLTINAVIVVVFQVKLARGMELLSHAASRYLAAGVLLATGCGLYYTASLVESHLGSAFLISGMIFQSLAEIWTAAAAFSVAFELAPSGAEGAYQGVYNAGQAASVMAGPLVVSLAVGAGLWGWVGLGSLLLVGCSIGWALTRGEPHALVAGTQ